MYDTVIQIQKEEKVRVNARIPQSLYDWVCSEYDNTSLAINEGLEYLMKSRFQDSHNDDIRDDIPEPQSVIQEQTDLDETVNRERESRIEDLKLHIKTLTNQLSAKDIQIEKLNEEMHKQAVHIQTLLENQKLLPENTKNGKPWWKIW